MNTNQKIARVLLTSKLKQLLVAVLSVTFGISMYVFMNSFMSGVNNIQTEITFTAMPHIKIHNDPSADREPILTESSDNREIVMVNNVRDIQYTEGIRNADAIKAELLSLHEIAAFTAQLNQNVFIRNGISKVNANLSGVEPFSENQLFNTSEYLIEGELDGLEKRSDGIILGTGLAKTIGVNNGDNLQVVTSDGISKSFTVIGLIETGAYGADKTRAMVSIQTARQLFSKNSSYATDIMVNVNNYNEARDVASKIAKLTEYKVEAWQEGNSQLDSSRLLRDIMAAAVSLTILIVAGFGIYNIMNMTVNEKIKEISILKAMGFNGRDVIEIFLTQSIAIGCIGGVIGLFTGSIIVRIVDNVPFTIATLTSLPMAYRPMDYVLALFFGIIVTFLAGYFPAKKASKIDPVEVLRG